MHLPAGARKLHHTNQPTLDLFCKIVNKEERKLLNEGFIEILVKV